MISIFSAFVTFVTFCEKTAFSLSFVNPACRAEVLTKEDADHRLTGGRMGCVFGPADSHDKAFPGLCDLCAHLW
jgi:hypothetical protein